MCMRIYTGEKYIVNNAICIYETPSKIGMQNNIIIESLFENTSISKKYSKSSVLNGNIIQDIL